MLDAVGEVRAAACVALGLHHARPHRAPPASRLQVEHVDRRRDGRQPHLQAAHPAQSAHVSRAATVPLFYLSVMGTPSIKLHEDDIFMNIIMRF